MFRVELEHAEYPSLIPPPGADNPDAKWLEWEQVPLNSTVWVKGRKQYGIKASKDVVMMGCDSGSTFSGKWGAGFFVVEGALSILVARMVCPNRWELIPLVHYRNWEERKEIPVDKSELQSGCVYRWRSSLWGPFPPDGKDADAYIIGVLSRSPELSVLEPYITKEGILEYRLGRMSLSAVKSVDPLFQLRCVVRVVPV